MSCISLAKIFLSLNFAILIIMCLGIDHFNYNVSWYRPLWVDLVRYSLCFADLDIYSFPRLEKFSASITSKKFFVSLSWDSYNANVTMLDIVPEA